MNKPIRQKKPNQVKEGREVTVYTFGRCPVGHIYRARSNAMPCAKCGRVGILVKSVRRPVEPVEEPE